MAYMFEGTKTPTDIRQYTLMRGVTDFGNLKQYDLYETGYPFLVVVNIPRFLDKLATKYPDTYGTLINNYKHILEYEFRGLEGLDNITSDTSELTNGINTLNVITKVNEQSAGTFTMQFFEKSGSTITKVHELYLKGIKDSRTQVKTYHGLIGTDSIQPGFFNEVFTFLYFVTDNSMTQIEKAYLIVAAQPTTAETNIYNNTKGEIGFKEISVEFNGFPYSSSKVNQAAKSILDYINGFSYDDNYTITSASNNEGKGEYYRRTSVDYNYTYDPTDSKKNISNFLNEEYKNRVAQDGVSKVTD